MGASERIRLFPSSHTVAVEPSQARYEMNIPSSSLSALEVVYFPAKAGHLPAIFLGIKGSTLQVEPCHWLESTGLRR